MLDPIERVFKECKTIAVVGASANPKRPSHEVALYLMAQGFKVIPVNPNLDELFGVKCYPELVSIPESVDVVDIFRDPTAVPDIVEQAITKMVHVVWMQPGAENMQAAERAMEAGLQVIMGVCMMKQHKIESDAATAMRLP